MDKRVVQEAREWQGKAVEGLEVGGECFVGHVAKAEDSVEAQERLAGTQNERR